MIGGKPPEAQCAVCMKRKQCVTKRTMPDESVRIYDNFLYSEEHRGWICKRCVRLLEKQDTEQGGLFS